MKRAAILSLLMAAGCTAPDKPVGTPAVSPTSTPARPASVEIASVLFTIPAGWSQAGTVFKPDDVPAGTTCELRLGRTESATKPDPWFDGAWQSLLALHTDVRAIPRASAKRPTFDVKSVGASMTDADGRRVHVLFIALVNEPAARAIPLLFLCEDEALFTAHREAALDLFEGATWLEGDVPLTETPLASGGWKSLAQLSRKN